MIYPLYHLVMLCCVGSKNKISILTNCVWITDNAFQLNGIDFFYLTEVGLSIKAFANTMYTHAIQL